MNGEEELTNNSPTVCQADFAPCCPCAFDLLLHIAGRLTLLYYKYFIFN
jgi:hypothetical protein